MEDYLVLDIISIMGIVIGLLLWFIGRKKEDYKMIRTIGLIILAISIVVVIPNFLKGFREGFINGPRP